MNRVSVITLTKDRDVHLRRLIDGLCRSDELPHELIVVDMSDRPNDLPVLPFQSCRLLFPNQTLPLAAARNLGAQRASGKQLLFLDVDCIPRRNLVAAMNSALRQQEALICAEVRYLGRHDRCLDCDEDMLATAVSHPARAFPSFGLRAELNPGLFWSLTFGIRQNSFARLGGFDEQFVGYGAEDTDFGLRAANASCPLLFLGGTGSLHQYHDVYAPPIQHVADIVSNANRFHAKWNKWPMEGWLSAFEAMGLVRFEASSLTLLRKPTPTELDAVARQSRDRRF